MNKIISPFIILSDDLDFLLSKIDDPRSIERLVSESSADDANFFLAPNHGQVLSFEHDFHTNRISLEIIDIDRRFEERFLVPQFTKWIHGFPSKQDIEAGRIRNNIGDTALYVVYGTEPKHPYFAGPIAAYLQGYQIDETVESGKIIKLELAGAKSYQNLPEGVFGHIRDKMMPYPEQIDVSIPLSPLKTLAIDDSPYTASKIKRNIDAVAKTLYQKEKKRTTFAQKVENWILEQAGVVNSVNTQEEVSTQEFQYFIDDIIKYAGLYKNTILANESLFIHKPICLCIKRFLANAFATPNVIVFIKNLEETHSKIIRRAVNQVLTDKVAKTVETILTIDPSNKAASKIGTGTTAYWRAAGAALESMGFEYTLGKQTTSAAPALEYEVKIEGVGKQNTWVQKYFEELEIPLNVRLKTEFVSDTAGAFRENNAAVKETIENLIRSLHKSSSTDLKQKIKCYVETNTNVINLWHDMGIVPNRGEPVIMFVDDDIHSMFLYPSLAESVELYSGTSKESLIKDHAINEIDFVEYSDLMSPKYAKDYYEISYRSLASAYIDSPAQTDVTTLAKDFDYPVFRYNVEHQNVLELTVNFNNLIFSHLNRLIEKRVDYLSHYYDSIDSKIVDDNLNVDFKSLFTDFDVFLENLKSYRELYIEDSNPELQRIVEEDLLKKGLTREEGFLQSIAYSLGSYLSEDAVKLLGDTGVYELAQMVSRLQQESSNTPEFKLYVGEEVLASPESLHLDLFRHTLNEAAGYEVELKTLPIFGIDSVLFKGKPAVVIANSVNILNENLKDYPKGLLSRYLSGFYYIKKFKHTISSDEIQSEITLYRPATSFDINIENRAGLGRGERNKDPKESKFLRKFQQARSSRE